MPIPHLNAVIKLQENRDTMQYDMIYRHASQVTHRNRRRNLDRRARGTDTKRSIPRDLRQSDKPIRNTRQGKAGCGIHAAMQLEGPESDRFPDPNQHLETS